MNKINKKHDLCELTIKLETWLHDELESYLITLNGIIEAKANIDENTIYVKYNCSVINYNWIKSEIFVFLKIDCPSILEFDKHSKNNNSKYEFVVNDYCCEYCLKGNIEYLLSINGIEKVYSNYSDDEIENIKVSIYYDKNLITEQDLKNINNIFTDDLYFFEDKLDWDVEIETARYSSRKENIINEEVINFNLNTTNKNDKHINIFIETNLPMKSIENMDLNNKINVNNFITDFLVSFEEKSIPNNITYDKENIVLEMKDNNLYTLNINFKIINLIIKKDFKLK